MNLSTPVRYLARYVALGYLFLLLIVPVGLILWRTFSPGVGAFFESITTPAAVSRRTSAITKPLVFSAVAAYCHPAPQSIAYGRGAT